MKRSKGGQRRRDGPARHETGFQCDALARCQNIHFIQKTSGQAQPQASLSWPGGDGKTVQHCCGVIFALLSKVFF